MKFKDLLLILSIFIIFTAIGCSSSNKEVKKGGYVEENVEIPEEFKFISNIKIIDDGSIVIAGYSKTDIFTVYESIDKGENWNKRDIDMPKVEGRESAIGIKAILNDGQLLVDYVTRILGANDPKEESKCVLINKEGIFNELDTDFINENNIADKRFINRGAAYTDNFIQMKNGDILYRAASQEDIVRVDGKTFQEKNRYQINCVIDNFSVDGQNIIVKSTLGIFRVKLDSNNEAEELKKVEDNIKKIAKVDNLSKIRLIPSQGDNGVYFESDIGLVRYYFHNGKSEIVNGTDYLGIDNVRIDILTENMDKEVLAIVGKGEVPSLIKYKYEENITNKPKTEITIYSLKEQPGIRSEISRFNSQSKDISLKYEIGITEGSAVTEEDAIKTLNTELMAGKGPDILVLDYLPEKSYEKQGVLVDLSSSVEKYKKELFTGIVDAYNVKGKVYRLPMEIGIPMILTEKNRSNISDKIKDINSFEDAIKEFNKENPRLITDTPQSPENFISSIYYMFENDWLGKDNKINEDNLIKFIEASKSIYNICNSKIKEEYDRQAEERSLKLDDSEKLTSDYSLNEIKGINIVQPIFPAITIDGGVLKYGPVKYYAMYEPILMQQINWEQFYYKVFNKNNKNIFIPSFTLGVNSNSKNKKLAIKVFEDLVLKNTGYNGEQTPISINKNAFVEAIGVDKEKEKENELEFDKEKNRYIKNKIVQYNKEGKEEKYNIYYPNKEEVEKFVAEIDQLNVEPEVDMVLLTEVCNQFTKVINEGLSPEEAVDNVVKNLELYLSE